jgi:putative membrane protein
MQRPLARRHAHSPGQEEEAYAMTPTPHLPKDLGEQRTILAADRTLMAWMRTSLSMLSFGFTIYKFLDSIPPAPGQAHHDSPQRVGLFLAALGTAAMVMGTLSYWTTLREMRRTEAFRIGRPVLVMALIMSVTGVALFVSIATRAA